MLLRLCFLWTWVYLSESLSLTQPVRAKSCQIQPASCLFAVRGRNLEDEDDYDDEFYETKFEERTDRSGRDWQRVPYASSKPYPMEYRSEYDRKYDTEDEETTFDDSVNMIDGNDEDDDGVATGDDPNAVGNFWVNPKRSLDPFPPVAEKPRRRRPLPGGDVPPSTAAPHERRPRSRGSSDDPRAAKRRTTFRSGTPPPPPVLKDFYNRLFWYGLDQDDNVSSGGDDTKTMFGGTKGKFNGLRLVNDERRPANLLPPPRRTRSREGTPRNQVEQRSRPRNDDYWLDDDNDEYDNNLDDVDDDDDDFVSEDVILRNSPDDDLLLPRTIPSPSYGRRPLSAPNQETDDASRRTRRRQNERPRRRDSKPERRPEEDDDDWVSDEVSSWFSADDRSGRGRNDPRKPSRKSQQESSPWDIFKPLGSIFGLNDRELEYQADAYNRRMGLDPKDSGRRKKRTRDNPRSGYAYRYIDDDEEPPIADFDVTSDSKEIEADGDPTNKQATEETSRENVDDSRKKQRTWKERAIAVERVPPANIAAWGPTGDLGIDARSKAWMDAQEDIQNSKAKLEERERRASQAREDVIILKADAELQRKRLAKGRQDPRSLQARLRQIELEIDDASRGLRRALAQVQAARDEVADLEDRHWAVLSLFNADRAKGEIDAAFRELEEQEPVFRYSRLREDEQSDSTSNQT